MDTSKLKGKRFANDDEIMEELKRLYVEDVIEYTRQRGTSSQFPIDKEDQMIFLTDCVQEAGMTGDYFFQDMWAAREIYRSNVKHVYDIGSRMDGYIAHLLAMEVHVTLLDIRPFPHKVEGIDFIQTNATDLSNIPDESIETLSSLCALEHFGLGRYGDPIDYNGRKKISSRHKTQTQNRRHALSFRPRRQHGTRSIQRAQDFQTADNRQRADSGA